MSDTGTGDARLRALEVQMVRLEERHVAWLKQRQEDEERYERRFARLEASVERLVVLAPVIEELVPVVKRMDAFIHRWNGTVFGVSTVVGLAGGAIGWVAGKIGLGGPSP